MPRSPPRSPTRPQPVVRIARPPNCFMLYRSDKLREWRAQGNVSKDQTSLSRRAGDDWNQESEDVIEKYTKLAELAKQRHAERYPGYKYQPSAIHSTSERRSSPRSPTKSRKPSVSKTRRSSVSCLTTSSPTPEQNCEECDDAMPPTAPAPEPVLVANEPDTTGHVRTSSGDVTLSSLWIENNPEGCGLEWSSASCVHEDHEDHDDAMEYDVEELKEWSAKRPGYSNLREDVGFCCSA